MAGPAFTTHTTQGHNTSSPQKERPEIDFSSKRKKDSEVTIDSSTIQANNASCGVNNHSRRNSCLSAAMSKSMLGVTLFGVDHHQSIIDDATHDWNINIDPYLSHT